MTQALYAHMNNKRKKNPLLASLTSLSFFSGVNFSQLGWGS
jgi:hypothetical protein